MRKLKDPEAQRARDLFGKIREEWVRASVTVRKTARVRLLCRFCCHAFTKDISFAENFRGASLEGVRAFGQYVPSIEYRDRWLFEPMPFLSWTYLAERCPNCGAGRCDEISRTPILEGGSDE